MTFCDGFSLLAVSASFVSLELSDDFFVVRVSGQFLREYRGTDVECLDDGDVKRVKCFGTTRNTSLLISGVTAALAWPVTEAAAAPIALSGEAVDASEPRNVAGAYAAAIGTVIAPCTANGQIRLQYWN